MNSSTINLYVKCHKETIWPFSAAWTACNLILLFIITNHCLPYVWDCMLVFMMTYTVLKEEEKCCQAQTWNR